MQKHLRRMGRAGRGVRAFLAPGRALLLAVGGGAIVLAGLLVPGPAAIRVGIAVLVLVAYLSLGALIAKEVKRQDDLRARGERARRRGKDASARGDRAGTLDVPTAVRAGAHLPLVTVVVTARNEQQFIADAIASVRRQTWPNLECIVIDDASVDGTIQAAIEATDGDARVTILERSEPGGPAAARNAGLERARGEFITFLDGDDFLYPRAIEARMAGLSESSDPAWVVGTYCLWHSVPEGASPTDRAPTARSRDRVSLIDAAHDAPFVVSAPLLRTAALRAAGGFDEAIETAEDYELWARLLRGGYVLDAVPEVGVAYRQKRSSLFRRTGRAHASRTQAVYDRAAAELSEPVAGPHPLAQPVHVYAAKQASLRRSVIGVVTAVASGDDEGASAMLDQLRSEPDLPFLLRTVDVEKVVHRAALRLERWSEAALQARTSALEARVWRVLAPALGFASGLRRPTSTEPVPVGDDRSMSATPVTRVRLDIGATPIEGAPDGRRLFLMPESAYHVDELGPLAELARADGVDVAFLVSDVRLAPVRYELQRFDLPVYTYPREAPPTSAVIERALGIVTMNDWGPSKELILACNDAGIPTFGKVEGVQDFFDDDVHWERGAYTRVATVLCQGPNDVSNTAGDRVIVGSTRLERIWHAPPVTPTAPLAVVNVNFTYGVLADARDAWVESAVAACQRAGVPFTLSAHPAERSKLPTGHVASAPIRALLTDASVLISRFSTVPFEAMARGVPFIYYNPHGERVPTFQTPGGAFPIARDEPSLRAALAEVADWQPGYRDRAEEFFLSQVDVGDEPSEVRTWNLLRQRLDLAPGSVTA